MLRTVKELIVTIFWVFLTKLIPARNLNILWKLGKFVGKIFYYFSRERKQFIQSELRLIFPQMQEDEITELVKKSFIDYFKVQLEDLHFPVLNKENIGHLITLEHRDILDKALQKGKGVIALHPHFGSYLLIMPGLGYNGYKVNQIAARGNPSAKVLDENPTIEAKTGLRWITYKHRLKNENHLPVDFITVNSLKKLFVKTKKNEIIAVSGTGRIGQAFAPVTLCGRQALLTTGPFRIALKTGAVLLPMFVVRKKNNSHRLAIEPAIDIEKDNQQDLAMAAQKFADYLTRYITEFPEQFGMRLWRMKKNAPWDDHPFFIDNAVDDSWKKYVVDKDEN